VLRASGDTTDRDLGAEGILREVGRCNGAYVDVGLFEGETHPDSEYTIPQIGAVHEFGTKPGTSPAIPERSWLRAAADENEHAFRAELDRAYDRVLAGLGKLKVVSALTAFGEIAASAVRKKITVGPFKPKADATLEREGPKFTTPLIWLGYLRAAVRSRIVAGGARNMTPKGGR
jgi:hypothetical protein